MSHENEELVHRAYARLQHGDIEGFLSYVDSAVEWHSHVLEMEGTFFGHKGVREWWSSLQSVFPDFWPTLEEARDLGDWVLVHARVKGSATASGLAIDGSFWQVARICDGRIVYYAAFRSEREALAAVGREQPMSRENVEALRAVYAEWAEGNFRAGTDLYDPHFLMVPGRADLTDAGRYLGPEAVKQYMLGVLSAWKDFSMAADELIEVDNSVLVAVRQRGVGRESEAPLEMHFFAVWTFRGQTAIRLELFRERNDALEAVGLREQAMSQEDVEVAVPAVVAEWSQLRACRSRAPALSSRQSVL